VHLDDLSGNCETEPRPPLARVFELSTWRNFSKIRSHSAGGIPGPVSLTLTVK
jgi:hypothetical protein